MVERQAEERVARFEQRHVGGVVGLGAGVGLDVGVLGAEQLLGAVDRQLLGDVDLLAAAVVAAAGVALGVLVGQHRADRVEHRLGHEVLRGDHLQRAAAGGAARASSTAAISGSTSASGAVWKFSGSSLKVRATIPTGRDSLRPVRAALRVLLADRAARLARRRRRRRGAPPRTPAKAPEPRHLLCPDLGSGPPTDLYVEQRRRRPTTARCLLHATSDVRSRGRGPMELRGRRNGLAHWMRANQRDLPGRRRPHHVRTEAQPPLHRRRRLVRRLLLEGPPARSASSLVARRPPPAAAPRPQRARSSTTACATSSGRRPMQALAAPPPSTPAATRTLPQAGPLGTSVGWSDIYPADYDQPVDQRRRPARLLRLRDAVDPQNLLYESNEHDNRSRRIVRLPYHPGRQRLLSATAAARAERGQPRGEVARRDAALAEDSPVAVLPRSRRGRRRSRAGRSARRRRSPGRRRATIAVRDVVEARRAPARR